MQNLRDKLLKAGLVNADQVKAAEQAQVRKNDRPKPPDRRPAPAAPRPAAPARPSAPHASTPHPSRPRPTAPRPPPRVWTPPPPEPGSKEAHRLASLARVEEDRRIRQLVLAAEVLPEVGLHPFHFVTRKGKLRRLVVSDAQAKRLESGELAVVERPEPASIEHSLVPAALAEELLLIRDKSVRFYNRPGQAIGFVTDEALNAGVSTEVEEADAVPEAEAAEPAVEEPAVEEPAVEEPAAEG